MLLQVYSYFTLGFMNVCVRINSIKWLWLGLYSNYVIKISFFYVYSYIGIYAVYLCGVLNFYRQKEQLIG